MLEMERVLQNSRNGPLHLVQCRMVTVTGVRMRSCVTQQWPMTRGGGLQVYKGVLQEVHEVAVKVFEGYVGQREQELLLKEITILRSCRNKNIVQFFGVTFHDSDIWMVMELMEGNLFRHLARGHHCTWYFRCVLPCAFCTSASAVALALQSRALGVYIDAAQLDQWHAELSCIVDASLAFGLWLPLPTALVEEWCS